MENLQIAEHTYNWHLNIRKEMKRQELASEYSPKGKKKG